ncbi:MAG: Outer membrane TonB-dependent transporter, utilization system for glycans and polysaccharides (PUL), SusC family [uncultured Cytophagales bacterium]|uniref:Outer membrane TonB-dependent transporter, utilization system for glycans and polysaccharides (PUL), SusC family n=1 Tax=uncultured Cytophagales bacterium TaxID=158755 RepID=A0A6J4K551_9SPHI|nr:MAG: Outer membrane TonB-dependent transporter, utilization system for glycans and polysaccharides (PUL), SusC family [uncultured Cytophagales bacterium]
MKKCLLLLLLLSCCQSFAQSLETGRRSSYYRYVFRISGPEARTLYRRGMDEVTDAYFHTVVDSFPVGKTYPRKLPVGHYLYAHAEAGQLVYELQSVNRLGVKLLNNKRDLTVHLHDSLGRDVPGAKVSLRGKRIPYRPRVGGYQLRKTNRRGLLAVTYGGFTSYHSVETGFRATRLRRTLNRVLYSVPVRYAWQPFRDAYRSIRNGYPQGMVEKVIRLFDPDAREGRFTGKYRGFMAFNQPRYRPGDTVKLKAGLFTRKGRPVDHPVHLRLSGPNKSTRLTVLKPYRKGAYEYQFVLHDSLKLLLDRHYQVSLEDPDDREYLSDSFHYEDYELKANTFAMRSAQKEHSRGQPMALYLKGVDENELNLLDARVELTVLPGRVLHLPGSRLFVPDTLWQHKQALEPVGETKIVLPDSLFPKASLEYTVEAVFLNAGNERHTERLTLSYHYRASQLRLELGADSLRAAYLSDGKPFPRAAHLMAFSAAGDTLFTQAVQLPFADRVNPYVHHYEATADTLTAALDFSGESPRLQCLSDRTADSVFIHIENPRGLPFWYTLYRGNDRIGAGHGDSLRFAARDRSARKYFVSVQYVWQGAVREEEFEVPFSRKQLRIRVDAPAVVYPGQQAQIGIAVTDVRGRPVAGADVTAYGVTKKFREAAPPAVPDFSRSYRSRKLYNTFRFREDREEGNPEGAATLDYAAWRDRLGLDSLAFYRFLYPAQGVYRYELPVPDSLTQLAPFVVRNGEILPVNILWVDGRPVYIRTAPQGERYAFPLDSGYHSLTLRTPTCRIELDSVYVPFGKKLILSADTRVPHPRKRAGEVPYKLSVRELNMLSYYLMPYRDTFGSSYSYLKQGNRVFPFFPASPVGTPYVGPVYPTVVEVVRPGGLRTKFAYEPGYEYDFGPGLLKMRSLRQFPYKSFSFPYPGRIEPDFRALAWTEREMDSLWRRATEVRVATREYFDNPAYTAYGAGKLVLYQVQYPGREVRPVKRVLLLREDDPNFLRVYPGTTHLLHGLEAGTYKLMLLLYDNYYLERGGVRVEKNGTNYQRLAVAAPLPPDARSRRLDSLVTIMVTQTVSTAQGQRSELQDLKEAYNQTYNVTNPGGYHPGDFTHLVRGVVTDAESGDALPGVNVVVKGAAAGTVTDGQGAYSLYAPPNAVLVFSFIGYVSEEVLIGNRSSVPARLMVDVKQLSEVVVTGYGTQQRKELVGSVSTVQSVEGMLQGRVAGVSITIRGSRSAGSTEPLVVVDGVPYAGRQSDLDPSEVLSIETLSGATAVTLYGSRGANGVILITTRKEVPADLVAAQPDGPLPGADPSASLRSRFADHAFWQPRLTTGRDGKTSFRVTFPDDITQWRTFVAAVGSKRRTGVAESGVKAFKTLTGNLALPRFLVQGDSAAVLGKVLNYTADTIPVRTAFAVNDEVRFQRSARVTHSLVDTLVLSAPGLDSLRVKYYVQKEDGYLDGELRPVPVFARGVDETVGRFLNLEKDTTLTLRFDPKLGDVHLYAQADVLQILLDEIDHVRRYEYQCNEQIASKVKSLLAEKRIRGYLGESFAHDNLVRRLVRKLAEAQQGDGGWGWWPDAPFSTWISAHVAGALVAAEKSGYAVPFNRQGLTDRLVYGLEGASRADGLQSLRLLRELDAKVDFARYTKNLERDTSRSFGEYLEGLEIRQLTGQPYRTDTLLKTRRQTVFGNSYWGNPGYRLLYSDIAMTLTAYRILKRQGGHAAELARIRGFLLEKRGGGHWRNTYEAASILETILPDLLEGDRTVRPSRLELAGAVRDTVNAFPYQTTFRPGDSLVVRKSGSLPLYLSAYQQFRNPAPEKVEKDFVVTTRFAGYGPGKTVLKAGKPVQMQVEVTVKRESDYVMIEVPIPAGCSYEEKRSWAYNEVHREYFRHKVSIFCGTLRPGKYTFSVTLLPRYSGSFTLNPAKAELMYFPVFFGRNGLTKVAIR